MLQAAIQVRFIREERPSITNAVDIAALVKDLEIEQQEHLVVLVLNRKNFVMERVDLYKGSVSSAQVRIGECFRKAVILNASAIVIVHNHPTGDPTPSPDDIALTRALVKAGELLDITVLDHVVIGLDCHVSLRERGLGFS